VVGIGIATDLLVYSLIIPVLPFRLEEQGYKNPSALVGYLLFAFVRARAHSPNRIFTPPCV
jgi:DHA1 family solute carrier family 18 vesicular amine transporter 1/2